MTQCSSCGGDCGGTKETGCLYGSYLPYRPTPNNVVEITPWRKNYPAEDEMVKAVKDVVYSFTGRVSVATAFGVLEIVTNDLRKELLP